MAALGVARQGLLVRGLPNSTRTSARAKLPPSVSATSALPLTRFVTTGGASPEAPSPTGKTVELAYDHYQPPAGAKRTVNTDGSLVVCHGLFGSKQNWRSLGKAMAANYGMPVYTLDLRNHGTSPHIEGMHYADMARDVLRFVKEKELREVALMGHSMGGKTVLTLALSPELETSGVKLSHLIAVDMSPARGRLTPEFEGLVKGMLDLQDRPVSTRVEADRRLQPYESELSVRQFLLTNLQRSLGSEHFSWRIPIDIISRGFAEIGSFPYLPPASAEGKEGNDGVTKTWDGKTLFLKGERSKYLNRKNIPIAQSLFPNMRLETLDTGHWVQSEKPNEFMDVVGRFLAS